MGCRWSGVLSFPPSGNRSWRLRYRLPGPQPHTCLAPSLTIGLSFAFLVSTAKPPRGRNVADGSLMAVKQVPLGGADRDVESLEREVQLLRELRHPHIVRYLAEGAARPALSGWLPEHFVFGVPSPWHCAVPHHPDGASGVRPGGQPGVAVVQVRAVPRDRDANLPRLQHGPACGRVCVRMCVCICVWLK